MSVRSRLRPAGARLGFSSRKPSPQMLIWSFLGLLVIGPILSGATEPWSLFVVQAGTVAVLMLCLANADASCFVTIDQPILVLASFGILATVQLLLKATIYRYATQQELLKVSLYFLFFFLARQLFKAHELRRYCSQFLAVFGGIFALFAIIQRLQDNGRIYWTRPTETLSFFGSYANKNHYAGLMEMLIPFALFVTANRGEQAGKRALFGFAACVMVASVLYSRSRAGFLAILFELAFFALVTLLMSAERRLGSARSALTIAIAIALVVWIGGEGLANTIASLGEAGTDASFSNRIQILHDSVTLVTERPLFGWGLGTFSTVYPHVQSWYSNRFVNAAHDDYLQLLVETGAVGLFIILSFLILVFHAGIRRVLRVPRSVAFAALVGCAGVLLHSLTDFNMHVPANAALFFALCGLICAASDETQPSNTSRLGKEAETRIAQYNLAIY